MFSIEMLPAQQGDALWIEYGSAAKPHRILVDGGTPPTVEQVRSHGCSRSRRTSAASSC